MTKLEKMRPNSVTVFCKNMGIFRFFFWKLTQLLNKSVKKRTHSVYQTNIKLQSSCDAEVVGRNNRVFTNQSIPFKNVNMQHFLRAEDLADVKTQSVFKTALERPRWNVWLGDWIQYQNNKWRIFTKETILEVPIMFFDQWNLLQVKNVRTDSESPITVEIYGIL